MVKGNKTMLYFPSVREIEKLPPELRAILRSSAKRMLEPVPIKNEKQARLYLHEKVERYREVLKYKGSSIVIVDKYIADAMNKLLATGFTYINLYAKDSIFLTEPHVASALAFNYLNHIEGVPDGIDLAYGLTYETK